MASPSRKRPRSEEEGEPVAVAAGFEAPIFGARAPSARSQRSCSRARTDLWRHSPCDRKNFIITPKAVARHSLKSLCVWWRRAVLPPIPPLVV